MFLFDDTTSTFIWPISWAKLKRFVSKLLKKTIMHAEFIVFSLFFLILFFSLFRKMCQKQFLLDKILFFTKWNTEMQISRSCLFYLSRLVFIYHDSVLLYSKLFCNVLPNKWDIYTHRAPKPKVNNLLFAGLFDYYFVLYHNFNYLSHWIVFIIS